MKKYPIVHLNGFMYAVDNNPIKRGDWYMRENGTFLNKRLDDGDPYPTYWLRVVASNDPTLKDLPLLPPVEEEPEILADKYSKEHSDTSVEFRHGLFLGYSDGLRANKAKQFTEEDIRKAMIRGFEISLENEIISKDGSGETGIFEKDIVQFIQSLKPKPTGIEVEMESNPDNDNPKFGGYDAPDHIKTEKNTVKGRYLYE